MFSLGFWNSKNTTELNFPRTNNSVEAWHHALQGSLSCSHPTVYKLIDSLRKENNRVHAIVVKLNAGEIVPLYSTKIYEKANKNLLNLLQNYHVKDPLDFLDACSHYVVNQR